MRGVLSRHSGGPLLDSAVKILHAAFYRSPNDRFVYVADVRVNDYLHVDDEPTPAGVFLWRDWPEMTHSGRSRQGW